MTNEIETVNRFRSIVVNSAYMLALQVSNFLIPFLIYYLISVNSGTFVLGQYLFFVSCIYFLIAFSDFGLSISALKYYSKSSYKLKFCSAVFSIKLCMLFLSIIIFPLISYYGNFAFYETLLIWFCLYFQAMTPVWYFQSNEQMKIISFCGIFGRVVNVLYVLFFINTQAGIALFLQGYLIGWCVTFLMSLLLFWKTIGIFVPIKSVSYKYIKAVLYSTLQTYFSRLSVSTYSTANSIIIGIVFGMNSVAIYGTAEKIYQAGQGVISPISQVLFPFMMNEPNYAIFKKITNIFLTIFIIGCVFIFYNAALVLGILFSTADPYSVIILRVFLIVSIVNCVNIFYGYPAFALIGDLSVPNKSVILGVGLYIVLQAFGLFVLTPTLIMFVVILFIVEVFVLLQRVLIFNKKYPRKL